MVTIATIPIAFVVVVVVVVAGIVLDDLIDFSYGLFFFRVIIVT